MKEEEPNKKLSKKEQKKIQEMMNTPDHNFELQFKCHSCNRKQNVKPGLVWDYGTGKDFSFDNEIICKFCFSNNMHLTNNGRMEFMWKAMRVYSGNDIGILLVDDKVMVENKKMHFKKSYSHLLRRIKQKPNNSELYLRAGNIAKRENKYDEAIKHYEKSIELNAKLIAAYLNLVDLYEYRYKHYKIKDAKQTAIFYLDEMVEIFRTLKYDSTTIRNKDDIIQFMGEKSESLGVNYPDLVKVPMSPYKRDKVGRKLGRNELCHCGSGKKYKKCCLNKDLKETGKVMRI